MPSLKRKPVTENSVHRFAATVLFCLGVLLSTRALATPDLSDFNMVFSDEFNGATLDSSKWNTGLLWGPYLPINNEEQLYVDEFGINAGSMQGNGGNTPSPFEMTGNSLKIIATPVTNSSAIPARPNQNDPIWDQHVEYRYNDDYDPANVNYLSGIITSYDSFRFAHGYAEARVKLPEGQGLWPAFWLLTSFYVEDVPEIDIMEFLGHDTETLYHTYHYFEPLNNWNKVSTPSYTSSHTDFTAGWHTFGVNWTPTEIIWYLDGVEARRISAADYTIPNQAMYVIANLATGGNWPGSPDNSTPFPAEFELDYIRVYQKDAPDTVTQAALNADYDLMFEDNFNGNSLDTSKWNTHHLWGPYWQINNEEQFYPDVGDTHSGENFSSAPVSVSNGTLKLTADVVDSNDLPNMPSASGSAFTEHREWRHNGAYNNPGYQNNNGDPSLAPAPFLPDFTSGIVTTYDSFKFTHGYAEIRAKLPKGDGLWPAFWLLNGYYVDQQPEIDVIEMRGELPGEMVHSYHLSPTDNGPPSYTWSSFSNAADGFANAYHTYGIAWEPGKLDWYIDGVKKHTHTGPSVSSQNMYAILNLAVGGNFLTTATDASVLPAQFEIDYLRIYQLKNEVPVTQPSQPPSEVVAISPLGDVPDVSSVTIKWQDGGDATYYRLRVKDNWLNSNVHLTNYRVADICTNGVCTVQIANINLDARGNHHWQVRGLNGSGWSDFGRQNNFQLLSQLAASVTPVSPLGETSSFQPLSVEWQDNNDAIHYRLQVRDVVKNRNAYLGNFRTSEICSAGLCTVQLPNLNLNEYGTHYWRVSGYNQAGWSGYGDAHRFQLPVQAPQAAVPIAPVGTIQNVNSLTIQWQDGGDAIFYRLHIRDKVQNANAVLRNYRAANICSSGTCTVQISNSGLDESGTHYWRVRGYNSAGWSAYGPLNLFQE